MRIDDCTIKELLSWAEDKMEAVPSLKYLRTLGAKYSVDVKWEDVPQSVHKKYLDLSKELQNSQGNIIDYVEDLRTPRVLPQNPSQYQDALSRLKAFIREYSEILYKQSNRTTSADNRYLCVSQSFISDAYHEDPISRKDLARQIGTKNNRCTLVDLYVNDFISKCRAILIDESALDGVSADSELLDDIRQLGLRMGSTISQKTFDRVLGSPDGRTTSFIVALFGKSATSDSSIRIPCITDYSLVDYKDSLGRVLRFFREEVIHIRFNQEYKGFLRQAFPKDVDKHRMFEDLVRLSDEFVWSKDDNDEDEVALSWDLLEFAPAEVTWILYEANAVSLSKALHSSEIQRLYNRKARQYNLNKTTLPDSVVSSQQRDRCWRLINVGKSKYWMLRNSKKWSFSLDDYVRSFLNSNPNGSYSSLELMAGNDGVLNVYETATLRSTFYRNGGQNITHASRRPVTRTIFSQTQKQIILSFAEDVLGQNNNSMFFVDLASEVQDEFSNVGAQTLRSWLLKDTAKYDFYTKPGRRQACVSLKGQVTVAPLTNREAIKHKAVEYLLKKDDYKEDKKTLYNIYEPEIPAGINKASALSSIFGDKEFFIRTDDSIQLTKDIIKVEDAKSQKELVPKENITEAIADASYRRVPSYEWEQLKKVLMAELNKPFNKAPAFNKEMALNAMYYIMAGGKETVAKNSQFHWVLSALPDHYSRQLEEDREISLKNNCAIAIEPFLKSFYKIKYGRTTEELNSDIRMSVTVKDSIGLGTLFYFFDEALDLLPYKSFCPRDSVEAEIKNYIWIVKGDRNDDVGHAEEEVDISAYSVEEMVHNTLCIFVYLASKL